VILTRLKEYADTRMELPPEMYGHSPVRWIVELDSNGTLLGFIAQGGNTKADARGERRLVPEIVRSSGIQPKLLADNGEYVLGVGRPNAKPARVAEQHRRFVELTERCAEETGEPRVRAVASFLNDWEPTRDVRTLPENFDASDTATFRVEGVFPVDLDSVRAFWASHTAGEDAPVMTCLVTGVEGPVAERLPVKIKGVPGGQMSGTSLVSANAEAFTHYGLENSLTSPISRMAGERFGKALNALISQRNSRAYVGPLVYVFWTRKEEKFDFLGAVEQARPEAVKLLFESPVMGQRANEVSPNAFYVLALSASGGRTVVRDWLETTVRDAKDNLRWWFGAQRISDAYGQEGRPLGLYALAAAAYRDPGKEMTAAVPASLMRVALNGDRRPNFDLLARAVRRNRAEGDVTRPRAALIKLLFAMQGVPMTDLQAPNPDPSLAGEELQAYHCGRMLAEIEAIQRAALGQVNATVTDRYYGSASSTPASVFPALMRGVRVHLGNLRRRSPGAHAALDARITEIAAALPDFPRTLTMRSQGLFALGYYHQRARDRAEASAAREARSKEKEG
jgi:CRISPR-associated protein Csd1